MVEDLSDYRRARDDGEGLHRPAAAGMYERIHTIDPADQAGPGAADRQGCPKIRARDWVRRFCFREEPVSPAVALRPVRVHRIRIFQGPEFRDRP